jgi:uncharacterized protein (UPF0218 family)
MELVIERGLPVPANAIMMLPEDMREELKVPLGPVLDEDELASAIEGARSVCTVGDMTTETVHRIGTPIHMAVVDYQTKREPDARWADALATVGEVQVSVSNPAATITADLYNTILEAWSSATSVKIVVDGEEDMAALPAILHSPKGATVIYGIPDTGLCLVQVEEGARDVVIDVLRRLPADPDRSPP